jgi:polysaccharide biosynthesis/export protein
MVTKRLPALAWLMVAALVLSGCSMGARGPQPTVKLEDVITSTAGTPAQKEVRELNEKLFASLSSAPQQGDYVITVGDLVQVSVFESQELQREARVGARGFITLPLLGPVQVMGMTTAEAEGKIEELYRAKYLHNPHVSVYIKEQQGQKVTVVGSVKKPGTYDYPARRRLLDALALAEGFDDKAGKTVQVRRIAEDPNNPTTYLVDMDQLIEKGRTELNMEIKSGDVIYVPEAGTVYVDGAVKKPGSYPIKKQMSINEAIAAAGGLTMTAEQNDVKLVRYMDGGKREVIQLTNENIQTTPVTVNDRDLIFVERNAMKSAFSSFTLYFGPFGGAGFSRPSE